MKLANAVEQLAASGCREPLAGEHQGDLRPGIGKIPEDRERLVGRVRTDDAVVVGVAADELALDLLQSALTVVEGQDHRLGHGSPRL
ncbi:MAG: hypothetical protein ACJ76S_12990 [Solirubrobacteraceae bacterium]